MNPWRHLSSCCRRSFCPFRPPCELVHREKDWAVEAQHFSLRPGSDLFRICYHGHGMEGCGVPWEANEIGLLAVNRGRIGGASDRQSLLNVGVGEWLLISGPLRELQFYPGADFAGFFLVMNAAQFAGLQNWLQMEKGSPLAALGFDQSRCPPLLMTGRGTQALHQLTQAICSIDGRDLASRLALEARTLEWLGLFWQPAPKSQPSEHHTVVTARDRRALEAAAHILRDEAAAAHSLADLSRRVHLNEFKLKRGFRLLWRTTVFGYLREQRLQQAEVMLRKSDRSVIEVANAVGYTNPSHFARAFKERFGLLPKAYQSMHTRGMRTPESV